MRTSISPLLFVLACGLLGAAGCAAEPPATAPESAGEPASPAPSEDPAMTAEAAGGETLTLGRPVTVRLSLSDEMLDVVRRHDVDAGNAPTLRLTLEELRTPRQPVSVRVFVNRADATAETPIDDPHYLGDVGFHPTSVYGDPGGALPDSSFLLDVGSTLAELAPAERIADDRYVDVTLIAMPLVESTSETSTSETGTSETSTAEAVGAVEIAFKKVRLSVHEAPAGG